MLAYGPARTLVRSTTFIPFKGGSKNEGDVGRRGEEAKERVERMQNTLAALLVFALVGTEERVTVESMVGWIGQRPRSSSLLRRRRR